MTTDTQAEDRTVEEFAVVQGQPSTGTRAVDDADQPNTVGDADTWWYLDAAPPRYSIPGMAVYEFAKQLWMIPEVLAVTHSVDRGINLVWAFLTHRDKATRRRIYEHERGLMAAYPGLVFNFHVAALDQGATRSFMRDVDSRAVLLRSFEADLV